ncbi:hypothetical protein [Variovorax sp. V15]|uniref:hypothetical protein n=1 Tax=Variovorax sp. V15 TaxID=3065952 RepID=UPI0034E86AA8
MNDTFRGDTPHLIRSIEALLSLDAAGALRPHGLGGHARDLLSSAAARLTAPAPTQEATAPASSETTGPVMDAVEAFLEAQDALDNREHQGINGEDYFTLIGRRNAARHDLDAAIAEHPEAFQQRVRPWLLECFGESIAGDRTERNHRFLEEALELVQACGCTASEAHQLVDYTFGRPAGEKGQEVGGVMVTLAALCEAQGLDMHAEGETELARISAPDMVARIRAKQAAKPKHSPLPAAPNSTPAEPAFVALRELVECKDLKGRLEGYEAGSIQELADLGDEYARRKPLAWAFARQVLAGTPGPRILWPDMLEAEAKALDATDGVLACGGAIASVEAAQQPRPDPKKCTAKVHWNGGYITTESCTTKRSLIDNGGSSDGERDYYVCPDCGKNITIDYREN